MNVLIVRVFSRRDFLSNSFTHVRFCANSRSWKYLLHHNSRLSGPDAILLEPYSRHLMNRPWFSSKWSEECSRRSSFVFRRREVDWKYSPRLFFADCFLPPPPVLTRNLSKHLVFWNVLEPGSETLPAARLLSNRSAWPPASQRRDELKHKASINIKVHRPHRAAKEHTVNLAAAPQTVLNATHTMALRP